MLWLRPGRHLPAFSSLSFIIWLFTVVMKYDYIRGTNFLGHQQADPAQGSIYGCCSHG